MTDLATVASFAALCLVIELTPGPNMVWLALLSATAGRRAGLAAVSGIALGLAGLGVVVAVGLDSLNPSVFAGLHWAGLGYLVWLAVESWRDAGNPAHHRPGGGEGTRLSFRHGLMTNVLNPKAAVFYLSVLPGFLPPRDPDGGVWVLTAIYVAIATLIHVAIVAAAGTVRPWLSDPMISARMHRVQAAALMLIVLWLAWRS